MLHACQCLDNAVKTMLELLVRPEVARELDLNVIVGPFQLFCYIYIY